MFKIKICGITDTETANDCCNFGADAIGLNFFAKSKRRVSTDQAHSIINKVDQRAQVIGLYVNHPPAEVTACITQLGLNCIQLHGDESPEILSSLQLDCDNPAVSIVRAIRISKDNQENALRQIEDWSTASGPFDLAAILLDSFVPKSFGGTGQRIDWDWLSQLDLPTDKPIILAGGLTPETVCEAIELVRPFGVDVAGGVEDSDGKKNSELISRFVQNAKRSFERI